MAPVTAVRGALIALTLVLIAPVALAAEQEDFYLGTDGFPYGSLVATPRGGEMPNFDLGRDIEPGLLLERSALGLAEAQDTRYQHWQIDVGGQLISGYPSVVVWSAPARFDAGKRGALRVYLLECNLVGGDCSELGAAEMTIEKGRGGAWTESKLDFEPIEQRFGADRFLGVRIVVPDSSESDMMLAYGYPKYRSRLTIHTEPPPPPVETVAVSPASPSGENEISVDKMNRLTPGVPGPTAESDDTTSASTWAVSLVLSTLMLVVLGAFLVSRLTKPGRHERRPETYHPDSARTERITVPASR
jgi:hypothetical protein